LVFHRRRPRFQAKAAQHGLVIFNRPNHIGAAGNAVAIRVVRVGMGQDVGGRNGLEQAQADHLRRNPWAEHGIGMQRAITKVCCPIGRAAQRGRFAV